MCWVLCELVSFVKIKIGLCLCIMHAYWQTEHFSFFKSNLILFQYKPGGGGGLQLWSHVETKLKNVIKTTWKLFSLLCALKIKSKFLTTEVKRV